MVKHYFDPLESTLDNLLTISNFETTMNNMFIELINLVITHLMLITAVHFVKLKVDEKNLINFFLQICHTADESRRVFKQILKYIMK